MTERDRAVNDRVENADAEKEPDGQREKRPHRHAGRPRAGVCHERTSDAEGRRAGDIR
jgi:hypothetical protein